MEKMTTLRVTPEVWEAIHKRKTLGKTADAVLREAFNLSPRERRGVR